MRKFLLTCLLALVSVVTWAYTFTDISTGSTIFYNINGDVAEVTWGGTGAYDGTPEYTGSVVVPETVTYNNKTYTVARLGDDAFDTCTGLTSITLPSTLTYIGKYAFYGDTGLTEIDIPDGVTTIDEFAFDSCTGLTSVVVPNGVTELGLQVFNNCSALVEVTLGENIAYLGRNTFGSCTNIEKFTIYATEPPQWNGTASPFSTMSKGVLYVPKGSKSAYEAYTSSYGTYGQYFKSIEEFEVATLLEKGEQFNLDGFYYTCVSAENQTVEVTWGGEKNTSGTGTYTGALTIPSEVTYQGYTYTVVGIGDSAFRECIGLTSVVIPNTVTYIGGTYVFSKCTSLTSVTIPESVTYIGDEAFYNCTALEEITIPNSVEYLGTYAFWTCSKLKKVTLPEALTEIGQYTFYKCTVLSDVNLAPTITAIGKDAFYQCEALETVELPDALTAIGDYAYYKCTALKEVKLKAGITTWDKYVFQGCSALTDVTFPDGLATLGDYAFSSCSALESVTFNSDLTSFGDNCFSNSGLKEVDIPASVEKINSKAFYNCDLLTTVTMHDGTAIIGDNAFYGCAILETIAFPMSTLTTIGEKAFYEDPEIKALTIPASVVEIESDAFDRCTGLASITFAEDSKLTTLGKNTFYKCEALTNVVLPNSITFMDSGTFYYCSALETVSLPENIEELTISTFRYCTSLKEVAVPTKVETIGNYAFDGCTALTRVSLSNNITDLGQYTFQNCSSLVDVIAIGADTINTSGVHIPDSIDTVKIKAFINCASIEEVTIPEKVAEFKNSVFQNCEKLASISCYNATPATLGTTVFDGIDEQCILYVPVGAKEDYEATVIWQDFYAIIEMYPQELATLSASDITDTSATLTGSASASYNESILERGFEYWADEDDVLTITSAATEDGEFSVEVGELMYGTTYTYRVYATTVSGTNYGDELTFTTDLYAPTVATLAATDLTDTSAVLVGEVSVGSEPITSKGFVYWETATPAEMTTLTVSADDFEYTLTALTARTSYSYRAFVKTDSGTVYGDDEEFTTDFYVPTVATYDATDVAATSAVLNGTVVQGSAPITRKGFEYWDGDANKVTTIIIADDEEEMSCTVEELTPETMYTYRAFVIADNTILYGADMTFTTDKASGTETGIKGVGIDDENIEGIYSTSGQKRDTMQHGVNIVRYNDGTVRKIYVK